MPCTGNGNGHYVRNGQMGTGVDSTFAPAFNRGCDARLAGQPLSANPFNTNGTSEERNFAQYWRKGWHDVDDHWGELSNSPFEMLAEVKYELCKG